MTPILLAIAITCTNGVAHIRVTLPGAGLAVLLRSEDARFWVPVSRPVVCSGPVEQGFTDTMGACAFYRVEWRTP